MGFYAGNNLLSCTSAEPQRWMNAINSSMEFVIAFDTFMTPSAQATCDVFLPLATIAEREGVVQTHYGSSPVTMGFMNKAVTHGEGMSDMELCYNLGKVLNPHLWEDYDDIRDFIEHLRLGKNFPTRVGVKIQDGCNNACTYCIVHVARGRIWSKNADEVVTECKSLASAGTKEIVLTGINLGSYECEGMHLAQLMHRLLEATKDMHEEGELACRFRISSIEPADVSEELIECIASSTGRICKHLHLPLQSGSSKVLSEMARPYNASEYFFLVERLRKAMPTLSLSSDIIVGFPGESESDFKQSLDAAHACAFSKIHVFPYSKRKGTPAAARLDQISAEVKKERAAHLRKVALELRNLDFEKRIGAKENVLVEQLGRAMTESYYEIEAPTKMPIGALISIDIPNKRLN